MKTVKKQFWFVSVILLALSAGSIHSQAIGNVNTSITEPANINSPSPQVAFSVSGRVTITLREEGVSGRARVAGIRGVTVTFTRVSGVSSPEPTPSPVQTDENGNWKQSGFAAFESRGGDSTAILYRATPAKSGLAFKPAVITFRVSKLLKPLTDLNFEAIRDSASASGKVTTEEENVGPAR